LLEIDARHGGHLAMSCNLDLEELSHAIAPGCQIDLGGITRNVEAEVASVVLFEDVADALTRFRQLGLKVWLASNLAKPYAAPVRTLLAGLVDGFCLSFEVGSVKPEPAFYRKLTSGVTCRPEEALMTGDTLRTDVRGARAFGLQTVHINRKRTATMSGSIRSLRELADWLEQPATPFGA
jgi:FMN phosphatase YigB (HAD superfamily)